MALAQITAGSKTSNEKEGELKTMETGEIIQKLLAELGIEAGPDATLEWALEAIKPIKQKLAVDDVEAAVAGNMLFADEREYMIGFAEESPLAFKWFLKKRGPVKTQIALLARAKSAPSAKAQMTQADREIARQLNVLEATFLKYNSPDDTAARSMTAVELEMAAKVGVKPELFAKYNRPANP